MCKTWQELIKNKMLENGISQYDLAERVGASQSGVAHWLSGRRSPDVAVIASLMRNSGVSDIVLHSDGSASTLDRVKELNDNIYTIEALDISASAGVGFVNCDAQSVVKSIEYDKAIAKQLFNNAPQDKLKIISVKGDSMSGTFESGDYLYVDTSINQFEGDGIYVFTFGSSLFVKRLQLVKNFIKVKSDNQKYDDWEIMDNEIDQLFINGKVVLSQSANLTKHG